MSANTNEKWLIVSCLKKSIRKGFDDIACVYAGNLYDLDKTYLIHIMRTVLLEDIFLGNINLINDFFTYINRKTYKKSDVISFVKLFSQSTKDRTAYDLMEIAKIKSLQNYSSPEEVLQDTESVLIDKFKSSKQILNKYIVKNPLSNDSFNIEKLLSEYEITENQQIIDLIKKIHINSKDGNFLLLGFLETIYSQEINETMGNVKTGDVINYKQNQEMLNNRWLIDAIDWHTQEGKSAIQEFVLENTETKKYLNDLKVIDNADVMIGLLLFKTVGQEVDKRLFYPTAVVASKISKKLELENIIGHKEFNQNEIFNVFKKDYPLLRTLIQDKFKVPDPGSFPF